MKISVGRPERDAYGATATAICTSPSGIDTEVFVSLVRSGEEIEPRIASFDSFANPLSSDDIAALFSRVREFIERNRKAVLEAFEGE